MNIGENGKLWSGLAILIVAGLGIGVWPSVRATKELDARIIDLSSRVARSDDGDAALARLRGALDERQSEAEETLKRIPPDRDAGGFIRDVSARFAEFGLGRPEIKTGRPVESDHATALPMTVDVRGGFLDLVRAVDWVESIDRLVRVRKLRFESEKSGGQEPLFGSPLRGELSLDVFYDAKTPSPLADAGEEAP